MDFSRERWKQRLIDTHDGSFDLYHFLSAVLSSDEEHRVVRSLKGKHVLAWRREDMYGLNKKLKWSTKCQFRNG